VNQGGDLGVFGLYLSQPFIELGDFPKRPDRRPLHADHEFRRFSILRADRIRNHPGHDRPHETHTHHYDDFPSEGSLLLDHLLQALEFPGIILPLGQRIGFSGGTNGKRRSRLRLRLRFRSLLRPRLRQRVRLRFRFRLRLRRKKACLLGILGLVCHFSS